MSWTLHMFSLVVIVSFAVTSQAGAQVPAEPDATPVWSVDLVRTFPGQQAEYLRNIAANWSGGRKLAIARGAVLSYHALAAEPDSARGWDVLLMTEYADSTAWADREEIFQEIFASPEYVRVETRPSSELREFASGSVTMWAVQ